MNQRRQPSPSLSESIAEQPRTDPIEPRSNENAVNDFNPDVTVAAQAQTTSAQAAPMEGCPDVAAGGAPIVSPELQLTREEQARRRRMLRNRESAARSREKRKEEMDQLAKSIGKMKGEAERLQLLKGELETIVQKMKAEERAQMSSPP